MPGATLNPGGVGWSWGDGYARRQYLMPQDLRNIRHGRGLYLARRPQRSAAGDVPALLQRSAAARAGPPRARQSLLSRVMRNFFRPRWYGAFNRRETDMNSTVWDLPEAAQQPETPIIERRRRSRIPTQPTGCGRCIRARNSAGQITAAWSSNNPRRMNGRARRARPGRRKRTRRNAGNDRQPAGAIFALDRRIARRNRRSDAKRRDRPVAVNRWRKL